MFQTKVLEGIKTHFTFKTLPSPPPENRAVYEIMWKKNYRAGQVTNDYMAHALRMLDT